MDGSEGSGGGGGDSGMSSGVSAGVSSAPSSAPVSTPVSSTPATSTPVSTPQTPVVSPAEARETKQAESRKRVRDAIQKFQAEREGASPEPEAAKPAAPPKPTPTAVVPPVTPVTAAATAAPSGPAPTASQINALSQASGLSADHLQKLGPDGMRALAANIVRQRQQMAGQQQPVPQNRPAPQLPELKEGAFEPELRQLRQYIAHQDAERQALQQHVQRLTEHTHQLLQQAHQRQQEIEHTNLHETLTRLDPALFGEKGKENAETRQAMWNYIHVQQLGYERAGLQAPPVEQIVEQGRQALFAKQIEAQRNAAAAAASQKLRTQATAVPTHRDDAPTPQRDRVIAAIRKFQAERGTGQ